MAVIRSRVGLAAWPDSIGEGVFQRQPPRPLCRFVSYETNRLRSRQPCGLSIASKRRALVY